MRLFCSSFICALFAYLFLFNSNSLNVLLDALCLGAESASIPRLIETPSIPRFIEIIVVYLISKALKKNLLDQTTSISTKTKMCGHDSSRKLAKYNLCCYYELNANISFNILDRIIVCQVRWS